MSLTTFSIFYFDFEVTSDNNKINFNEGAGELTGTVDIGSYSLTEFLTKVKNALDAAGTQVYTVTVNRDTRLVSIIAGSSFDLLITSGTNADVSVYGTLGFSGADQTGLTTYTGSAAVGQTYEPQFIVQDHIASGNFQQSTDASVNRTTNGKVEVIRFGIEKFVQMNIRFITDLDQTGSGIIKTNLTGIVDAQTFMQHITLRRPVEFMPDIGTRATFEKLLLETTPTNSQGVGYKLTEQFGSGLPGYFDTGILKFRVII